MMKLFQKLKSEYQNCMSLEGRIFLTFVPISLAVAILVTILALIEQADFLAVISCAACALILLLVFTFFRKNHLYFPGLAVMTILLCCIVIPISFFTYGGFDSAMSTLMICSTLICALCIRRRYSWQVFTLILGANLLSFYLAMCHPELVTPIPEKFLHTDYLVSFAAFSVAFYMISRNILTQTLRYSKILKNHMDDSIQKILMNQSTEELIGKRTAAVLFLDISHFTSNTENMDLGILRDYCNTFFEVCDTYISRYEGIFDKYIGDCVMVFWVENEGEHESVYKACRMAHDVIDELAVRQKEFVNQFGVKLECSGGIDFGEVILGDIGGKSRKGFTIIGDTVNTASRLESIAAPNEVLLSQHAGEEVMERLEITTVTEKKKIRGKAEPMQIYTL